MSQDGTQLQDCQRFQFIKHEQEKQKVPVAKVQRADLGCLGCKPEGESLRWETRQHPLQTAGNRLAERLGGRVVNS